MEVGYQTYQDESSNTTTTVVRWRRGVERKLKLYHLKIVQSRQSCILVERRILCLREGLLHEFRIWSAQYRIDDSGIKVCPPRWWRWRDVAAGAASSRIFDAPAEKALHCCCYVRLSEVVRIQCRREVNLFRCCSMTTIDIVYHRGWCNRAELRT